MSTGVVTPEAVRLELPTAGVATRTLARLVDLVVQVVLLNIIVMFGGFMFFAAWSPLLIFTFISVFIMVVFPIGIELVWRGKSVGKHLFGLVVVGIDGAPVTPRQVMTRGALALLDTYASLGFLALATGMSTDPCQRPGDLVAGTVVIFKRAPRSHQQPIAFIPPYGYEHYVAQLDVRSVTNDQFSLIREFLLRVDSLDPHVRQHLARTIAERVRTQMNHELPMAIEPERWLVCVASAIQMKEGGLLSDAQRGLAPIDYHQRWRILRN